MFRVDMIASFPSPSLGTQEPLPKPLSELMTIKNYQVHSEH